jgi:hypothetical protein
MNAVLVVVAAMWILPILAVMVAHFRLSRQMRKSLALVGAERAIPDARAAQAAVRVRPLSPTPVLAHHDVESTGDYVSQAPSHTREIRALEILPLSLN